MSHRTVARSILALLALSGAGCGTVANLGPTGDRKAYGGVGHNCKCIKYNIDTSKPRMLPYLTVAMGVIDMPLTALADTLTLPLTVATEGSNGINKYYFPPGTAGSPRADDIASPHAPMP